MNFNFKNGRMRSISSETKASFHLSQCREWICGAQSLKKKIIMCLSNWKTNFNSKNHWQRCFSIETKASISLIPMRRMCLWHLLIKRKEIIMLIPICPNRWMNINSKNGRERRFSYETKASIPFIPIRRMYLWCPTMKWNKSITWIHVFPN